MPEMAHAGEDHGKASLIGGGNHLVIAHGAARLDHGGGTRLRDHVQSIGKREEGIGCGNRPGGQRLRQTERLGCVFRFSGGDTG